MVQEEINGSRGTTSIFQRSYESTKKIKTVFSSIKSTSRNGINMTSKILTSHSSAIEF